MNNILIVSLIIIVILLVVAVNMLSDMYTNKSKKREGFANIAEDPSGQKLNTFLNKGKEKQNKEQFQGNPYDRRQELSIAKQYCPVPLDFDISQYKKRTEPDDSHPDLKDYVLKSSIPPAHKCPSCVCPKVSVLAGVGADAVCPPCPVQRCPPQPKIEIPKCPPPQVCPEPKPCENKAPIIKVYQDPPTNTQDEDQNTLDWLRQALEETEGDGNNKKLIQEAIQRAIATMVGRQIDSDGVSNIQTAIDKQKDHEPNFFPNYANPTVESFVNAPKTFTVDGQLI
tara:strand:+ start:4539 stop:5387 length:849 start_codon:yes stop_codon:yes gene_type:complete